MTIRKRFELAEDSKVTAIGRLVAVLAGVSFFWLVLERITEIAKIFSTVQGEWIVYSFLFSIIFLAAMVIVWFIIYLLGLVVFWILDDYDWDDVLDFAFTIYKMVFGNYEGKWGKYGK